jgi:hypothetical protein
MITRVDIGSTSPVDTVSTSDSQPGRPFPLHLMKKSVLAVAAAAAAVAVFSQGAHASTTDGHSVAGVGDATPQSSALRVPLLPPPPAARQAPLPDTTESPLDAAEELAAPGSGHGIVLG